MLKRKEYKFWFCTGSQDLYGDECLAHVAEHAQIIVEKLNESGVLPYEVVWKPTLITNELIRKTFNEANIDDECAGVMRTVPELSHGCIHFHRQNPGSSDFRSTENHCSIFIHSLTWRFLMTQLIWTL